MKVCRQQLHRAKQKRISPDNFNGCVKNELSVCGFWGRCSSIQNQITRAFVWPCRFCREEVWSRQQNQKAAQRRILSPVVSRSLSRNDLQPKPPAPSYRTLSRDPKLLFYRKNPWKDACPISRFKRSSERMMILDDDANVPQVLFNVN